MVKHTKAPPDEPLTPAAPPARRLAQEQLDFTAEGSPPPGHVAGTGTRDVEHAKAAEGTRGHTGSQGRDQPDRPGAAATGRRQPPAPAGPARRASKRNPTAWGGNR